jgi:CBS domain-containing protein
MKVEALLKTKGSDVYTVPAEAMVDAAVAKLAEEHVGALVVTAADGAVEGIISERDVVRQLHRRGAATLEVPVAEVMSADVVSCRPDDDLASLMEVMTSRRIRHLPVMVQGRLVGIVSIGDVVKARVDELEDERRSLHEYISAR